jgi:hypothetical protein
MMELAGASAIGRHIVHVEEHQWTRKTQNTVSVSANTPANSLSSAHEANFLGRPHRRLQIGMERGNQSQIHVCEWRDNDIKTLDRMNAETKNHFMTKSSKSEMPQKKKFEPTEPRTSNHRHISPPPIALR